VNNSNHKFLLVQGRAIPQTDNSLQYFPSNWKEEFPIINKLGFSGIEWIYDKKSESSNPLLTETGRKEMLYLSKKNNVNLENIVFDWFLSYSFLQKNEFAQKKNIEKFLNLMQNCADVGFKRIIFPLLDKNKINSDKEIITLITHFEKNIIKQLDILDIEIHFETLLSPEKEKSIMTLFNHKKIKICFDMGNSASVGFDPIQVINILDNDLGSVHIKDRKFGGSSVPIGQGDVKFQQIFRSLNEINFHGPISFQIYRNRASDNILLLQSNLTFINEIILKSFNDSK
jgi:L-ribulose-5-phosphate 3-epimerase